MRVRRVEPGDREDWERLFRGYNAFYHASVADAVIELTWQRLLAGGEGEPVGLLAVDDQDLPVGLAHIVFHRSTWSATWHCYLEDLFVDAALRGKGIGRVLIAAVYSEADARGCTRTYWTTDATNATARALYDRVATKTPFVQYRR
ncbi:MAG: GNAT family N-acetyltransferase [Hyphomicrobiaceae bacterium]|nr:GNAT family N-acetyltransferase [Hyphomicrobiaceae bacterium]